MTIRDEAEKLYAELAEYAASRTEEYSKILQPYTEATDSYGKLICRIVLVLGSTPPRSKRDAALRDLMGDVFDSLYETRALILKGKVEMAYPLARRAFESLSLMIACHLDPKMADSWIAEKQVFNSEVRKALGKHRFGESKKELKELYAFFSGASHPNRSLVAHRFLGEGNEFVLGAIGRSSLVLPTHLALRTLSLWFWCVGSRFGSTRRRAKGQQWPTDRG